MQGSADYYICTFHLLYAWTAPLSLSFSVLHISVHVTCSLGDLHVQASDAMSHVAGYTVAHDVNARDWQMYKNGKQWLLGKSFDTFCPLGPALVTTPTLSGTPHDAFLHR